MPTATVDERINELETKLDTTRAELRDLATMGAVITSIQEMNAVLSVVMDTALRMVNGEVGAIMLADSADLHLEISWGLSEKLARSIRYREVSDVPTFCYQTRQTVILNDVAGPGLDGASVRSVICLPIQTSKTCHGVMILINKAEGGAFTQGDQETLERLLNFVAVAIDNAGLIQERLSRQKIAQEMAIARQVQETILPQNIDSMSAVGFGTVYVPAREVGGDFYDVFPVDKDRFLVIIGDVSNKGVPAALVMSAAAGIIKSTLRQNPQISVASLASAVNDLLADGIIRDRGMFVTMFFAKFDLSEGVLTYCNAGHIPGLYWDNRKRSVDHLSLGGPIVGQFAAIPFKEGNRRIGSGDRLFLFTDGLTEAANAEGALYGRDRAERAFADHIELSPKEFCLTLKRHVDGFASGAAEDTHDDFTVLQVKVH